MQAWRGPAVPFEVLLSLAEDDGLPLPPEGQAHYPAWRVPVHPSRPWLYVNFVISRDGRVSFSLPGAAGGGEVSGFDPNDQWLMGLLRARADAVMVGDNTLRTEPEHLWTAEYICPQEPAFAALRREEERAPTPLQVVVSLGGMVPTEARIFQDPALRVVIASTEEGVAEARARLAGCGNVEFLPLGADSVDLDRLLDILAGRFSVSTLLCEGGPTLYGSLLAAGLVDEEFLTLSPLVLGNPPGQTHRPGLVEGVAFAPGQTPRSKLRTVLRTGDYLFLRSRYH